MSDLPPPEELNGPITLRPYDPTWPQSFEILARRARRALGASVVALHHAGSTSVPGLAAKPIIDMVAEVADSTDETAYAPRLEAEGFVLHIREPEWFEHRLLRHASPAANLHVFSAGCEEVTRMLAFRDHLREDAADRELYQLTKQVLASRTWARTQDYADAKSDVVAQIMARALQRHERQPS